MEITAVGLDLAKGVMSIFHDRLRGRDGGEACWAH